MKNTTRRKLADIGFGVCACLLFFGCIASSIRTAKTVEAGQISTGGGYLYVKNLDHPEEKPLQLLSADVRAGLGGRVDAGIMHTWDLSPGHDGAYSTLWGDVKVQLTNPSNELMQPTISTGLMKGYDYRKDVKMHFTSIPIMASLPITDMFTPTIQYRAELISEEFRPNGESFDHPRSFFALGAEFNLTKPDRTHWSPKLGVSIGTFNALDGRGGDGGLTFNIGFTLDSPLH